MRIGWMVAGILAFSGSAGAADVTVYFTGDVAALNHWTTITAGSVFENAGITVNWRGSKAAAGVPPNWLRVELADRTPGDFLPGALAMSYPYAGCEKGITVFLDRIQRRSANALRESALLAYVLVHEIAHVVQGVYRHSTTGVMKARWDVEDKAAIFERRLGFLEEDVVMMRNGLAAGMCRQRATVIGPSAAESAGHPE